MLSILLQTKFFVEKLGHKVPNLIGLAHTDFVAKFIVPVLITVGIWNKMQKLCKINYARSYLIGTSGNE